MIKIIKERIRKKKRFLKIKNVKLKNYLKIIKVAREKIYVKKKIIKTKIKNVIIKNVFAIINFNSKVIVTKAEQEIDKASIRQVVIDSWINYLSSYAQIYLYSSS